MYRVIGKGKVYLNVAKEHVASLIVDCCGCYTEEQTAAAMDIQTELYLKGEVVVGPYRIEAMDGPLVKETPWIGDRVRSYDFADDDRYYVEGVIVSLETPKHLDGARFKIAVRRWVVDGRDAANFTDFVYPLRDGRVEKIKEDK